MLKLSMYKNIFYIILEEKNMKKKISKFLAGLLAFSLMLFSVPSSVYGAEYEVDGLVYEIKGGGLILTDCTDTSATRITIPEKATLNTGAIFKVVGIKDYAFGYCNNLSVVHVPTSLKESNMGNVSFLTASSIVEYINAETGENATTEDVVKYIAKQLYGENTYTDEQLNIITTKLMDRINKVDTSGDTTLEGKLMTLIKNIDKMGLTNSTIDAFNNWIAKVKYKDMIIKGQPETEIQSYVNARSSLGLNYEITYTYLLDNNGNELYYVPIDSNGDGKSDSISITGYSGNIQTVKVPDKITHDKQYLPVTSIGDYAFSDAIMLNTIYLPRTVTEIGEQAIGYFSDGTLIPNFTIYGYADTMSQRYARRNSITFKDREKLPVLTQTELTLDVGAMMGIMVENYEGEIKWVSSDTTIATVDGGYVKGLSGGEVTVYAILDDNTMLECAVTITAKAVISTIGTTTGTVTTLEPPISLTSSYSQPTVTTTLEPAISLTSSYTQPTVTTTLEPAISLTSSYTQPTVTTTLEPAISLTSSYTQPTVTTTLEPAISLTSKTTSATITTSRTVTSKTVTSLSTVTTKSDTTTSRTTTLTVTVPPISISSTYTTTNTVPQPPTSLTITTTITSSITSSDTQPTTTSATTVTSTSKTTTNTSTTITTTSSVTTTSTTSVTTITTSVSTTTSSVTTVTTSISTTTSITTITSISTTVTSSITKPSTTSTSITSSITTSSTVYTETVTITITSTSQTTTPTETQKPLETKVVYIGDANEDGTVNVRDAAYIAKMLSINQVYMLPDILSDVNQDNEINVRDAAALARKLANGNKQWVQIIIKVYPI